MSHASRSEIRAETLRHLSKVGIYPSIMLDSSNPPKGTRRLGKLALTYARGQNLLILEDDIRVITDFPLWLNKAEKLGKIVTFCLMETEFYRRKDNDPGFYPVYNPERWYGTQAILIPGKLHPYILERYDSTRLDQPFDLTLGGIARDKPDLFEIYAAIPNPVQHICPPSLIEKRSFRQSKDFWRNYDEIISSSVREFLRS